MSGFQGFIVTQFVSFGNKGNLTGGCSARSSSDVPITTCEHEELNENVRTTEIKIGILLIYVALALNLFMLSVGQVCIDEVARLIWISKKTHKAMKWVQNWVFRPLLMIGESHAGAEGARHDVASHLFEFARVVASSDTRR